VKRLFLLAAIAASLLPIEAADPRDPQVLDGVAAAVNTDVITFSQVRELTAPLENAARNNLTGPALSEKIKEVRTRAVNDLIDRQLILQEFRKMKGATIPSHVVDDRITALIREEFGGDRSAFLKTIAAQGYTLDRLRKMEEEKIIVQAMRSREVKGDPIIPESKIQAFYSERRQEWTTNDEVKLRMIKILAGSEPEKKRQMIREIREKIVRGADFGDLARIYSEDSTQDNGGDWGWVKRGDLSGDMERVVFGLKKGKVSDIVELNQTYYLLLADDRKDGVTKPLKEVRDQIEKYLIQQERQKMQQAWLERLRKKAFIKIY
jgi:parvulin-like peptidyl-prolyl isomerase